MHGKGQNPSSWLNSHLDSSNLAASRAGSYRPISALASFNPSRSAGPQQQQQHGVSMPALGGRFGPRTPPDDDDWDRAGYPPPIRQQPFEQQPRQYTDSFQAHASITSKSSRPISAVATGSSRPTSAVPSILPQRSSSAHAHARGMTGMRGRGAADEDVDAFVQEADDDAVDNDDWDTLGGGRMGASRGPPVDIYRRCGARRMRTLPCAVSCC